MGWEVVLGREPGVRTPSGAVYNKCCRKKLTDEYKIAKPVCKASHDGIDLLHIYIYIISISHANLPSLRDHTFTSHLP